MSDQKASLEASQEDGAAQWRPVSAIQSRFWVLQQLEPASTDSNVPLGLRLRGPLNARALMAALQEIVRRHQVLRTVFSEVDGTPRQRVTAQTLDLRVENMQAVPPAERELELQQRMRHAIGRPFDLGRDPLMRGTLFRLARREQVLLLVTHHIAMDGWSQSILCDELSVLYNAFATGQPSPLPELPTQYCEWRRLADASRKEGLSQEGLSQEGLSQDGAPQDGAPQEGAPQDDSPFEFWKRQLAGAPWTLQLPTDDPRGEAPEEASPPRSLLGAEAFRRLQEALASQGATLYMGVLAAFSVLLTRLSGQSEVVIGSPFADRGRETLEGVIGPFLSMLALRLDLSDNPTFLQLLQRTRKVCLEAIHHGDLPVERLQQTGSIGRESSRRGLFDCLLNFRNLPAANARLRDLTVRDERVVNPCSKFGLTVYATPLPEGIEFHAAWRRDRFSRRRVDEMLRQLTGLLDQAARAPQERVGSLSLVTDSAWAVLPNPRRPLPRRHLRTVLQDVAQWTERSPDATAVSRGERSWSYRELSDAARAVASELVRRGVRKGEVIGLQGLRGMGGLGGVAAMLGTMASGAVCLPIDDQLPIERQQLMLRESGARRMLSIGESASASTSTPAHVVEQILLDEASGRIEGGATATDDCELLPELNPRDAAYVMFTSGTSGPPRGVLGVHDSLSHFVTWQRETFKIGPGDRVPQLTSPSFDVSLREVFLPLTSGATLCLPTAPIRESRHILQWLTERQITVLHVVPSLAAAWLAEAGDDARAPTLKHVFFAGEPLSHSLLQSWRHATAANLVNLYGPTETTLAKFYEVTPEPAERGVQPVSPLPQCQGILVNASEQLCGIGEVGEILIRTPYRTRGYLNPGNEPPRFISNPLRPDADPDPNDVVYRTGDMGRYRPDGKISILGRNDDQLKIRGVRVEPQEVAAELDQHPAVVRSFVTTATVRGEPILTGYVVAADPPPSEHELRSHLGRRLPTTSIPSRFVMLDRLPLTANGKVDRRLLPAPTAAAAGLAAPPQTPLEKCLARIWQEVLSLERVSRNDDFFRLGGHSLLAAKVISRICIEQHVDLPLRTVFEHPTIAELAEAVAAAGGASNGVPAAPQAPARALLKSARRDDAATLSFGQQRMWLLDRLLPNPAAYNGPLAFRLEGPLDGSILLAALTEIVRRHQTLRTVIEVEQGEPRPRVLENFEVDMPLVDLSATPEELNSALVAASHQPFDLQRDLMLRACLFRLGSDDHVLLLVLHHIASDGWSRSVLSRELSELFQAFAAGQPSPLQELPLQYSEFAVRQRQRMQGELLEQRLAYWKQQLAGAPPALEIPADRPRPAIQSFRGATFSSVVPDEILAPLRKLSCEEGGTLFFTVLAAFKTMVSRFAGQQDVVVGSPIAGRDSVDVESLIGFFVNTLALRTNLAGATSFRELVRRVRKTALDAFANHDLPFERLIEELNVERDLSRNPLCQVIFAFQNMPQRELALPGLRASQLPLHNATAKSDLMVSAWETPAGLQMSWEFNTDLYDVETVKRMSECWTALLTSIGHHPDGAPHELALAPEAETRRQLVDWNRTRRPSAKLMIDRIEAQVSQTPQAVAVIDSHDTWTYRQLNARANQIARWLRRQGIRGGDRVALRTSRSADMLAALLAILKCGAAYVPLDPSHPAGRCQAILSDAAAAMLIVDEADGFQPGGVPVCSLVEQGERIAQQSSDNLGESIAPEQLAYILFTSGSTGRPKGVMTPHRAVANLLESMRRRPGIGRNDVVLALTTVCFDISVLELFLPLIVGARVILADRQTAVDGQRLGGLIRQHAVSLLQATPATWRILLQSGWRPAPETRLWCGGEALDLELARRLTESGAELWNMYGPTETTVYSTISQVDPAQRITIGHPIDNTAAYVLDGHGQPTPIGVPGELHIGGRGVARGYWQRAALTAERFVRDPFANDGSLMYRTGDQVRWLACGALEFLGRRDGQIKLRGYRIELGEVEQAVLDHEQVAQCIVDSRGVGDDQVLVAYVVADGDRPCHQSLRRHLEARLPAYMIPSAFVDLEALPRTPSGKLDRRALPAPRASAAPRGHAAPATETELRLASIWRQVLNIEGLGRDDDFFLHGGHSLKATQVVTRIASQWGVELPLRVMFEAPTIRQLAQRVNQMTRSPELAPIAPVARTEELPLSFAQQRLWFVDRLAELGPAYHMPLAVRLQGTVNVDALQQSVLEIVKRHESLRTVFELVDGQPCQRIRNGAPVLEVVERTGATQAEWDQLMDAAIQQPFDLSRDSMLRARLFRHSPQQHTLLLVLHHVAADGWSLGVLRRELSALYSAHVRGEPSELPPLPVQFADFAVWQRERLAGDRLSPQLDYWRKQLAGAQSLELPTDRPRPAQQTHRGASHRQVISTPALERLQAAALAEGTTLFAALLATLQAFLSRYAGQEEVVIGSPTAGRARPEVEGLIGCFVNTVVLRGKVSGDMTFRELMRHAHQTAVAAQENQELPFERLVEELQPQRDLSRSPFFQVMFAFQNMQHAEWRLADLEVAPLAVGTGAAKVDLALLATATSRGLEVVWNYNRDLFDPSTIQRMGRLWSALLDSASNRPDEMTRELDWLPAEERQQLIDWSECRGDRPLDAGLVPIFQEQVDRSPDQVAVICGRQRTTYAEIDARSNQLARHLLANGSQAGVPVAICLRRGVDLIVAQLAALKAGSPYVPLDPACPPQRLGWMLADCGAAVLLTERVLKIAPADFSGRTLSLDGDRREWSRQSAERLPAAGGGDDLAYIMYTSGSTGRPKGVATPQRAVTRLVIGTNYLQLDPTDVVAQAANAAFDAATFEIWGPLLNGAQISVVPADTLLSPRELQAHLARDGVTTMFVTTALFHQIAEQAPETFQSLKSVLFGGETASAASVRNILRQRPPQRLLHVYGPTEATTFASWHLVERLGDKETAVPIGRPIGDTSLWVLDAAGRPAPVGVPGEIFIGGRGVAAGYWGRPDLTAERFLPNPFDGGATRWYRTGDLAKWRSDGRLEFIGRLDGQVKLRGFRIELAEVEAALVAHANIGASVVVLRQGAGGDNRLAAYYVARPGRTPEIAELRRHLAETLPDYMIPADFVALPKMPLNANGKVDRPRLPEPAAAAAGASAAGASAAAVAPRTSTEAWLARIWTDVMGLREVGVDDDFFDLGGHSLLGVRLFAQIERVFRVCLPMAMLFQAPTIARLAAEIDRRLANPAEQRRHRRLVPLKPGADDKAPIFCVHGGGGHVMGYRKLALSVGEDRPVYGIEPVGIEGRETPHDQIEQMATAYLQEILAVQPAGPYYLCGYSVGGLIVYEIAQLLQRRGEQVALLALLDTHLPRPGARRGRMRRLFREARGNVCQPVCRVLQGMGVAAPFLLRRFSIRAAFHRAAGRYEPQPYAGAVTFFRADGSERHPDIEGWRRLVQGGLEVLDVPTRHSDMLDSPELATRFAAALQRRA